MKTNRYISVLCLCAMLPGAAMAQITLDERETASVSVMTAEEIEKNSSINPYNMLYGLLPGLSVMQRVEWNANPSLILRGSDAPLIIIDGYERSLEYISGVEIESVKVLKDGAATSVYGPRGSKGVVFITTKRGDYNKREISLNFSHGMSFPVNQPKMASGYDYALAYNEALYNDGQPMYYTRPMLDALQNGSYPDLFANTDWLGEALGKHSDNNQLDITFRGGGDKIRYYTALSYKNEFGILNPAYTKTERYNSQLRKYDLNLRMNLDVDITPTTLLQVTMFGSIKEKTRPKEYNSVIFPLLYNTPAAAYPVRTTSDLWGGSLVHTKNPIATFSDSGYFKENPRALQADMKLNQKLNFITDGLYAEVAVAFDNYAVYKEEGSKTYQYEVNTPITNIVTGGDFETETRTYGTPGALSINCWGMTEQYMRAYVDGKIGYQRNFNGHEVTASAEYLQEYWSSLGRNNTTKRLSVIGQAGYSFKNRYMLDASLSYAGTSRLPSDRYRLYPSVSAAWLLTNEDFMSDAKDVLDYLKIRASWGQAGNDGINYELVNAYWESNGGYNFTDGNSWVSGLRLLDLPVENLTLEYVDKYNIGLDLRLFKRLSLTADVYMHNYRDVLVSTGNMYSSVLGCNSSMANIGAYDRKGAELAIEWRDRTSENFSWYIGANVSYVKTNVIENGEGYKDYEWMSGKGRPIGQIFGYEAIGYFRDEQDIADSPEQTFSSVRPGDIKYRDLNGDDIIDTRDVKAIGKSGSIPEWYGGIYLGFEYKGFGLDMLFQGTAGWSTQLTASSVYRPLRNNVNVSEWYLKEKIRWTEQTKDVANMPRLSTLDNSNNYQTSTQWLVDASYFKLRNVNIYYKLPKKWTDAMKMKEFCIYLRGNNLFSLDHVPYLNSENMTLNYPDMLSAHLGVNITF